MIKKTWTEFRSTGLLWFINRTLHLFGWAIVVQVELDGKVSECFPARVEYRGFHIEDEGKGFQQVSDYLVQNAEQLAKEAKE